MREVGSKVFVMIDNKIRVDTIKTATDVDGTNVYTLKSTRSNSTKCYFDEDLFDTAVSLAAHLLNNIKEK